MGEGQMGQPVSAKAPPRAQFRLWHLARWLPLCLIHGTGVAWLAFGVQKYFAPLGLFPILVGLVLGVTLAGLMRLVQVANMSTILLGAAAAWGMTVFGQHYFSFQEQRETAIREAAQFRVVAQAHPDLVRGTPPEPASGVFEYLRRQALLGRPIAADRVARGVWAWASWALDGCLTLVAALLVIWPASRRPYCNQCGTWFSTVRRGRLDSASAKELAVAVGVEASEDIRDGVYRFVHCQGGCGVAGFELCWELVDGSRSTKRVWVFPDDRSRLEKLVAPVQKTLPPDP